MLTRIAGAARARPSLWRDPPGERFARRHARLRSARTGGVLLRAVRLLGGALLCVLGIVFVPLPGPGLLAVAAGAALMAGESRSLAQRLDRAELWLRARLARRRR